jgi:hypothetical protein
MQRVPASQILVCLTMVTSSFSYAVDRQAAVADAPRLAQAYGRLPMSFEVNQGQSDSEVKFLTHGSGYALALTRDAMVLSLQKQPPVAQSLVQGRAVSPFGAIPAAGAGAVLQMRLLGANAEVQVSGVNELPGKSNYFLGKDPAKWRTNVPNYARVKYAQVYPGVDLVYYGNQQRLEFDFVVQPGADPNAVRLNFEATLDGKQAAVRIDEKGDLVVGSGGEQVVFPKPVIYQATTNSDGKPTGKQVIDGSYKLARNQEVSFEVAPYDKSKPLVIDPTLVYSTYYNAGITSVAVDSSGNAYVTGYASPYYFPTTPGAFLPTAPDELAISLAFVSKMNADGTALVYSTYLGGTPYYYIQFPQFDWGTSIAVDASGSAYLTGSTNAPDFPASAFGYSPVYDPYSWPTDYYYSFVTKLSPDGSALVYSTALAGCCEIPYPSPYGMFGDYTYAIAIDAAGNAYVTGTSQYSDFPITPGAFQTTQVDDYGYYQSAFVTKLNPNGGGVYSTFLGPYGSYGNAIAADASGDAYVVGTTDPTAFPITPGAIPGSGNAFITKLNPAGSSLVYSALPAGSSNQFNAVTVDSAGNAYITGKAGSDFPTTAGAYQATYGGGTEDAIVAKVSPDGSAFVYSTFLGGTGDDQGQSVATDAAGNAYVTGSTASSNFPTTAGAFQTTLGGDGDAFVTKLNSSGSALLYSTYLGGADNDTGLGIAINASGVAVVSGTTKALGNAPFTSTFPTTPGAFNTDTGSSFISKFSFGNPFCSYTSRLRLDADADRDDGFDLNAQFALGTGASIDPTTQSVSLTVGPYSVTIPAGSFKKRHEGYAFDGKIGGVRLAVAIVDRHEHAGDDDDDKKPTTGCTTPRYALRAIARGAMLTGVANPVATSLTIGDSMGTDSVTAFFER